MSSLPHLVAFDLDDTLAPSKSPAPQRTVELLIELLRRTQVAVISGGNFDQFLLQLVRPLEEYVTNRADDDVETLLSGLHLLPTCGTRYYQRHERRWVPLYEEHLTLDERARAAQALERHARRLGLWESLAWGEIIEDRGSQVTFSALGQRAPVDAKAAWDPSDTKKNALRDAVARDLPDLEVRSGGSTSVDITRRGIDKAYGMRKLAEHTGISLEDMHFVGDRLDPDGNDYPVVALGVPCTCVADWEDTVTVIERMLHGRTGGVGPSGLHSLGEPT